MFRDPRIGDAEAKLNERRPGEALTLFDQVLDVSPDEARAWQGRGRALNNLRRFDEAESAFRKAVELDPGNPANHNFLGHVLRAAGRAREATAAFQAAIDADPAMAAAHYNLATALAIDGNYAGAVAAFERSIELGYPARDALLNLGELYQFLERYPDAVAAYRRALTLDRRDAAVHSLLGDLWYSLGEVEKAAAAYDAALQEVPGFAAAVAGRALLCEIWGDIDAGLALLDRVTGEDFAVDHARARLLRRQGQASRALEILQRLAENARRDAPGTDPTLFFTLGEVCDELGDYAAAFAAFDRANRLKPAPFDPDRHDRQVDTLIRFFDRKRIASLPRARPDSACPVFIVGMPRSGTSLVEQILASHAGVHAGGERFEIPEILRQLGDSYPQNLESADTAGLDALARRYREGYGDTGAALVWTDKLPKNFLHLGLIALLFPNARVIYCRRDMRDTGLSVYFQNMNFRSDPWTSRLEHIAAYARACARIMRHWQEVLPLPVLEVTYEKTVEEPERQIRHLLAFLDLPWEPRCLEFHRTKRLVNTASYAQVRQPIYRSSLARWKNYTDYLGPLAR